MPALILSFVEGLLGPKFEKFAKPLIFGALGLLILLALWGGKCAYDKSVIAKHEEKQVERAKPATDQAAKERADDTIKQAKNEQEAHDAVHSVPDAAPAGPSHALACARLRKRGHAPAACR